MQFTIPINAIRAVELFAAKNDARYYMNGISVRALTRDVLQLVGSNGHILAQYRHTREPGDGPYQPDEHYILPCGLTAGIKITKDLPGVSVTAHVGKCTVAYVDSQKSGVPIDGR